ncbi:dehydration-responsive element-binding protein 1A-like [Corylus avellana]|uniref:dehydration-responsive element-binding protein 1A-like n=1 Tax=Corylus avellana TaxID=13451 RepID=UPI00286A6B0D|nr:dehydration-responsive element-binding protein 1A-like [Corylus avellana]
MDIFTRYSEPHPFGSPAENPETASSLSDAGHHADEEVILASSKPKRRTGRKKFKETRHPVYRGVRRRNNNKWVSEMRKPNEKTRIWLGTYPSAEMAARAHDVAALALRGTSACLNFADSAWSLRVPASTDAGEIRRAAAVAAEEFRPSHDDQFVEVDCGESVKGSCEEVVLDDHHQQESVMYMDDEALFDMPGLLVNMAEGLLLSPPTHCLEDDMESNALEVSLWSFSI